MIAGGGVPEAPPETAVRPGRPFTPTAARSIDAVLDQLTRLIDWAIDRNSRIGYFAALYRKVTRDVEAGIRDGAFDDPERMERFDVIFANRYLEAVAAHQAGRTPALSWAFAFRSAGEFWPIVLQHLLLGMNAHINLDLGIATAKTMEGRDLESIRGDFDRINLLLASLVDGVQEELTEVWALMRLFNRFLGDVDDQILNFSMHRAREEAWRSAERLWSLDEGAWPTAVARQDGIALGIARLVRHPGVLLGAAGKIVRIGEVSRVSRVIEILS